MYSPWRDRLLLNYCQHITEQGLLLRSSGAPFIGEGEKYWSVIDDPEIEILKALWEGEDYLRIPTARRVWGKDWCNREEMFATAKAYAESAQMLGSSPEAPGTTLTVMDFKRGVWVLIAAQAKRWDKIVVHKYFEKAKEHFLFYVARQPRLEWLKDVIVWEGGDGC